MPQSTINDFYTVIKKKPDLVAKDFKNSSTNDDVLDLKSKIKQEIKIKLESTNAVNQTNDDSSSKVNQIIDDSSSKAIQTTDDSSSKVNKTKDDSTSKVNQTKDDSCFKVPTTPAPKSKTKSRQIEIKSDSFHLNKKKLDLNDNQESILKWAKRASNSSEQLSSAEKKKRLNDASNDEEVEQLIKRPPTVKKRLFDTCSKLDEIREKILNTDEKFLNKLNDFKAKTASPVKLDLNCLNSPSKRLKEQEERRAKARELISQSPKKFLQDKLLNSPFKSPTKLSKNLDGLSLPAKYKALIDNFHCLDSVVSLLFNRLETCTFDKIKSGIQKITKKNFDQAHIAQILTIYPNSYALSYEKKTAVDNLNNLKILNKSSLFYLVLRPKLTNTIKMTPSVLRERRDKFEKYLNKYARKVHNDYLLSLEPPVVLNDDELTRWHPSFLFPNIPESELPEQPTSVNEAKSIDDFWATKLKIEKPIKKIIEENKDDKKADKTKIKKGVLKGLSQDFLMKIKNKEAVNLAKEMTRKPEIEKRITEIKRLPELIRIIHSFFTIEKKKAIQLSQVIKKCLDSSTSFTAGNCSELIHLINELLPDWLLVLKTSQGTFIKINKDTVLKSLYDRLDRHIIKLKDT